MTTKAEKEKAAKAEAEPEEETSEQNVSGPVATPVHDPEADVPEPPALSPHNVDDGVEDPELGPAVLGGWVQLLSGDYANHFAAYLANVEVDDDGNPTLIQVRTRDADNATFDIPYTDVTSTTYSGGR